MTETDAGHPAGSQAVKIGVLLPRAPGSLGEWLADGAAYEAAGADALWVDLEPDSDAELDPLALTAALAATTFRSLLVTTLPASGQPSQGAARTLATIGRLSSGRLGILADPDQAEGVAEVRPAVAVFRRAHDDPATYEHTAEGGEGERWISVPSPDGRATWRAALRDAVERGAGGLLVPAGPRLLDILRNPESPGDRRDLRLAQG